MSALSGNVAPEADVSSAGVEGCSTTPPSKVLRKYCGTLTKSRVPPNSISSSSAASVCESSQQTHLSSATCTGKGEPPGKRGRSIIWQYFKVDPRDRLVVICQLCERQLRLGRKSGSTTTMHTHISRMHPNVGQPTRPLTQVPSQPQTSPTTPQLCRTSSADSADSSSSVEVIPAVPSSSTVQMTPPMSMEKRQKYHANHPIAQQMTSVVAKMLAVDMLPFSFVENAGFQEVMSVAVPRWKVPSRVYFAKTAIPELYAIVHKSVRDAMENCEGDAIHLTIDMWTSGQQVKYFSVTAHWVCCNSSGRLERQHATLALCAFEKSHTAANILRRLREIKKEWLDPLKLVVGCVVTDNEQNIVKAVRDGAFRGVVCMAHCLNLVVRDFLERDEAVKDLLSRSRRLCTHFHHSCASRRILRDIQASLSLPLQHLVQEVPAEWNSTFHMLERLYGQRQAVQAFYLRGPKSVQSDSAMHISPQQWQLMGDLLEILRPFEDSTELISQEDASLSQVMPLFHLLVHRVSTLLAVFQASDNSHATSLASLMLECLRENRHLDNMWQRQHCQVATALDPRFKRTVEAVLPGNKDAALEHLQGEVWRLVAQSHRKRMEADTGAEDTVASTHHPPTTPLQTTARKRTWDFLEELNLMPAASVSGGQHAPVAETVAKAMYKEFLADDSLVHRDQDPLLYWQDKREKWPALYHVAVTHLGCPPSTVLSKRLFNCISYIVGNRRMSLSSANLERLAFMKMNMHHIPTACSVGSSEEDLNEDSEDIAQSGGDPEEDLCDSLFAQ
uniref:BED-type domain-containing protein n=1 Tax=Sphenodon punctatus TaxID=8508 RepID=A0A8D0G2D8_SPHPU